jgi:hypothetical protein
MKHRERVPYTPEVRSGDGSGRLKPPEESSLELAPDIDGAVMMMWELLLQSPATTTENF